MNIFILTKYHTPGGTERLVCDIANELANTHTVHLALRTHKHYKKEEVNIGPFVKLLNLQESNYYDWSKWKNLFKLNWWYFIKISYYLLKHNIDVIYAHDASISQAAILKLYTGKKLVWHNHNGEMLTFSKVKINRYKKYTLNTDAVISINSQLTSFCKQYFGHIKHYYTVGNFIPYKKEHKYPEILFKPHTFHVVHVGNIREVKNQLYLIQAWSEWIKKYPNSQLSLIGNIIEEDYYQIICLEISRLGLHNSIRFLHQIETNALFLSQASAGVLTSKQEGFGIVLLEYAQAGLPVLTVDIPACMEVIKNGETGYFYEQENKEDFIAKLETLYLNPSKTLEKVKKMQEELDAKHTKSVIVDKINQVIIELERKK